jgi:hypothetical protein
VETQVFGNGVVLLRYERRPSGPSLGLRGERASPGNAEAPVVGNDHPGLMGLLT